MDIDVDDFMRKTASSYNFQYIDLGDLDRIIRNVQRKTDEEVVRSLPARSLEVQPQAAVRMLSDEEINAILESTQLDLQEARESLEEPILPVIEEPPELDEDDASTICSSSSSSSSRASSVKEFGKGVSDEVADVEDNLGDDFSVDDLMITFSGSRENAGREPFESIEPCFEFLDSESIVEEVLVTQQDGNEGDSEGSGRGTVPTIRVKSPIKPASALIKTYERECDDPINDIQPVLDFAAIERASKSSPRPQTARSTGSITVKSRPPSRKSLVEEFDTFIKITELQKKVCVLIDDVRLCIGKLEEPEDELEEKKRERRTAEFLIRFQRNYLYQINRLEEDICVLSKGSPETAKKIYQLYRTVGQALKFYLKNMKYFVINVSPEKLWTLVKQILSSTKLCVQKDIFDEDDLIVAEINEKCHLLRHRLKEEVAKQKSRRSKNSQKPRKITSSHSANPLSGPKLSMYGTSTSAQNRPRPARKSSSAKKPTLTSSKKDPKKSLPKPPPIRRPPPQQAKIIAVPMTKSSSSSLGRSSKTRLRTPKTPAKTIDDVVTLIQQRTDPLGSSRLLKEVSGALSKMSGSRDAAISPEINQQLHQLIMETIQNITQQQLQQMMPKLENPTTTAGQQEPNATGESVNGVEAVIVTAAAAEENRLPTTESAQVTGATDHATAAEKCFSNPLPPPPSSKEKGAKIARKSRDSSASRIVGGVEANRPRPVLRDCVGDSQSLSSDSGKINCSSSASGGSGRKGVDLEICGGKSSCSNAEVGGRLSSVVAAVDGCGANAGTGGGGQGQGKTVKGQKSLLEERKKRSQRLPRQQQQPPQPTQHKVNYSHNLQYLEIVSLSDSATNANANAARRLVPEVQSHLNLAEEVANHERRQRRQEFFAQLRKQVSRDRRKTIHRMASSPVYVNGNFEQPWQTVSRVSDQLIEELIADTAGPQGLDFGERSFVEDFLRLQLGG